MSDTVPREVELRFDPNKKFELSLRGKEIKLLLDLLASSHFKGENVFLVADTTLALQKCLMEDSEKRYVDEDRLEP